MPSLNTISKIKEITPAVAANAETITRNFYQRMFRENPEVKAFFNVAHQHSGAQQRALADAVAAYFSHIENPGVLKNALEVIAQKHCALQVQPEQYPIVGKHLLAAIKDVFGSAATDEVLTAVGEAYQFLATVLIERERQIYQEQAQTKGGWNGYRQFRVERKILESSCTTSFYLVPGDNGPLPDFKPGQFITIRTMGDAAPRNYSLSDAPGKPYFRISVKREVHPTNRKASGAVSNHLHDHVHVGDVLDIGAPSGTFFIDPETIGKNPVVFLAGGIGVTPLLPMLKSLADRAAINDVYFAHANRNGKSHAFAHEVKEISASYKNLKTFFLFDEPLSDDPMEESGCYYGRITRQVISDFPCETAHFFFCGPKPFMTGIYADLLALGVSQDRLHFEFFGPMQPLI